MKPRTQRWLPTAAAVGTALLALPAHAQQGDGTEVAIQTSVVKPAKVPATAARIAALKVPAGFSVAAFATDLKNVRMLAVGPDGSVYATRRDQGDVIRLVDANGDGRADGPPTLIAARSGAHGIAIHDGKLYLITVKEVFVGDLKPDGSVGELKMIIGDLPDSGQHPNRTIAFGPDGMLYISVGSTCNACNESNPESATLLRASPDGKSRTIVATGLRNTIGFDWHPVTGELWGMDNGIDFLGDDVTPEELNRIEFGKQYGWPHVFGTGSLNPQSTPPGEITKEQWRASSVPMVLGYAGHAAPLAMIFYSAAAFPAEYRNDAFVSFRGSWNRARPSGYEVARVRFENGKPTRFEPFLTGFLTDGGKTHIARPAGLAVARDGSLLVADDANGVIYRVAHGKAQVPAAARPESPATAMQAQGNAGSGVPLALQRPELKAPVTLQVSSSDLRSGEPIPPRHSEYMDGVSPALQWTSVARAMSYALIVEDPDAKPITPFVHWVAWNIPANVMSLRQGLQEQARVTDPPGILQGRTSRGSVGYFGPRPPVGDPPHHYHFQVLALDTVLEVPAGSGRDEVIKAAQGHVLASGELVGTYAQTVAPLK